MSTDINHVQCGHMHLNQKSTKSDGNKTQFEGVISSTKYDSQFERFGPTALHQMAKAADDGVKVLAEHNHLAQPIGKSLTGKYDSETGKLTSRFYIQKGLKLRPGFNNGGYADSDSYIAAAQEGTSDGLSVGAIVKNEVCDHCGAEMKRFSFFGMTFIQDENDHYPGQKIYVDAKGKEHHKPGKGRKQKIITATIKEADLIEFSMVTIGANPDAVITDELQKAFEAGQLRETHLAQLNDRFAIKVHGTQLIGGLPKMLNDKLDDQVNDSGTDAGVPMPPPLQSAEDKSFVEALKLTLAEEQVRRNELESENEQLRVYESRSNELEDELREKDKIIAEMTAVKAHVDAEAAKIQKYDVLCEKAVDYAIRNYVRWKSTTLMVGEDDIERSRLIRIQDYTQIMDWGDLYRHRAMDKHNKESGGKADPEAILNRPVIDPDRYNR